MMITRIDIYALIAAVVASAAWMWWSDVSRRAAPVSDWFVVRDIFIPNFREGEDPRITYNREIKKPFSATWSVELRKMVGEGEIAVCMGHGVNDYAPNEVIDASAVSLSWFMGRDCSLSFGDYIAVTTWEVRPEGYPVKILRLASNQFRVFPEGAQLYVTPEQLEKLEAQ